MARTTFSDVTGTPIVAAWLNAVDKVTYSAANIAALKLFANPDGAITVSVLGYTTAGDGGGGLYRYDPSDVTTADNGGSVIVSAASGRWKLLLWGLPSVKQFGATGDGSTNDLTAIQNAYAAFSAVWWPNGTYNLGNNTWTPPAAFAMYGQSRRGVKITRTGSGVIMTLPYLCTDAVIENIYFIGSGNTGIAPAATAGAFQGYTVSGRISKCDFAWELAYGLNWDPIFCVIQDCNFGVDGTVGGAPSPGASTMVAFKAAVYPATANYTNVNRVRDCKIWAGSLTAAAVQLTSGSSWLFENCDFENAGVAVSTNDINKITFDHCWFERNTTTNELIVIAGTAPLKAYFKSCTFTNNTINTANRGLFNYASTVPIKLEISDCTIGKNAGSYVLYDNATTLTTIPANGTVAFYDNIVSGDTVGDKCVTGTNLRGGAPRIAISYQTAGGVATILSSSDPGATIAYNAVGTATITASHPLGTAANNVVPVCTPRTANAPRAVGVTTTTVQVQSYSDAGVLTDGIVGLVVYGS